MSDEIACHSCDLLVHVGTLRHGESASCPRCGCFLTRYRDDAYHRILAFASAGLIFLVLANSYSFLSFSSTGHGKRDDAARDPRCAVGQRYARCGPAGHCVHHRHTGGNTAADARPEQSPSFRASIIPGLRRLQRCVFLAQNWSMVEVFIIGVIVSLVKIAAMATVVVGASFWAYAAFAICFTAAVANLDRYQCWERIEALGAG